MGTVGILKGQGTSGIGIAIGSRRNGDGPGVGREGIAKGKDRNGTR